MILDQLSAAQDLAECSSPREGVVQGGGVAGQLGCAWRHEGAAFVASGPL